MTGKRLSVETLSLSWELHIAKQTELLCLYIEVCRENPLTNIRELMTNASRAALDVHPP